MAIRPYPDTALLNNVTPPASSGLAAYAKRLGSVGLPSNTMVHFVL